MTQADINALQKMGKAIAESPVGGTYDDDHNGCKYEILEKRKRDLDITLKFMNLSLPNRCWGPVLPTKKSPDKVALIYRPSRRQNR